MVEGIEKGTADTGGDGWIAVEELHEYATSWVKEAFTQSSSGQIKNMTPPSQEPGSKSSKAVEVFFSYSHKDEELRDELATHLSMLKKQGLIQAWHDREITAGTEWANEIDENLDAADLILLLVSANFLASDYCYDIELKRAMERYELKEARLVPIILKPVDWSGAPFGKLQALPKNAKPVTTWQNRDEALLNVAQGIRRAVEEIAKSKVVADITSDAPVAAFNNVLMSTSSSMNSDGLTDRKRRRLEQERDSLEQQRNLISEKLSRLREALAVEVDPSTKLKLEKQLGQAQADLNQIDEQLEQVEQQLG
jgi:hypothetical protein